MALNGRRIHWSYGIFLTIFLFSFGSGDNVCSPGIKTKGYTVPHGDIMIEHGGSLNILCILNDDAAKEGGPNASSQMSFYKGDVSLPKEMIQIVNSSSIKLYVPEPPLGTMVIDCKLNSSSVCMNFVFVGHKPDPVTDFKCIGYNYENLTCTWTPPQNYIHTDYVINYTLKGRRIRYFSCPNLEELPKTNQYRCVWSISTTPSYRQVHREYTFFLSAKNLFGEYHYNETFLHFKHVLPAPPEELKVLGTTTNSIMLSWKVPSKMEKFPPGLHHRVLYQCQFSKLMRLAALITDQEKETYLRYNLTDLKHPHELCDIRISIRSAFADITDESMWSQNASVTVLTKSAVPAEPPETNIGSYEVVVMGTDIQAREAYIYWKQIPEEKQNGPNFKYYITLDQDHLKTPENLTSSYAKFANLSIAKSYTFNIWSRNANGTSHKSSIVRVPRQTERVGEPLSFIKVEHEDGVYELSWEPPKLKEGEKLSNFTLFWCLNDRDRPYQCTGKLDWIMVPPNRTFYNKTLPRTKSIYQFAISSNTLTSSSGMLWASCTVINKNMGKMKNVWINHVGSRSIELGWKLDCSSRVGTVEGYVIYYCPIQSPTQTQCKTPQHNQTVNGNYNVVNAIINDLKPYTTYMLTISVKTRQNYSPVSDPLFNTTLEEAPSSPPLNVDAVNVTNSSLTLKWDDPTEMNGILKYYKIRYNDKSEDVSERQHTINNLASYGNYSISIQACTTACSAPSKPLYVTTQMGYPGVIDQPTARFLNKSLIEVIWKAPQPPRGKIDFYEVQVKQKLKGLNVTLPVVNVTGRNYWIEDCGEDGKYNSFYISVRAVNMLGYQRYEGPWSEPFESYCKGQPIYVIYIIICIVTVVVFVAVVYFTKKLYFRCQIMRDVEIKLPPGLAPVITSDHTRVPWNSEKIVDDQDNSPADEEMLLAKISEGRHQSGDSSGCSSGHESVTSSLQSGSHVPSSSDSGTEQPRSPSVEELRMNSLRLRNVPSARPSSSKGYTTMPPPETIPPAGWNSKQPTSGYCLLGVDPTTSSTSEAPYVPVIVPETEIEQPSDEMKNSLRLRNVSSVRPAASKGYIVMPPPEAVSPPAWNDKVPTAGSYCVLGVDPSTKPNTESNTEQPKPPLPDELARNSSLRLRNVPCSRPTPSASKGYVVVPPPDPASTPEWNAKAPAPSSGNYCVLGMDPTAKSEVNTPYVQVSSVMDDTNKVSHVPPYQTA